MPFLRKTFSLRCSFRIPLLQNPYNYNTLFVAITERVFFMKKFFGFPHLRVSDICAIAMLMALTAILAIFCTFRIGDLVKIPFKFISVFIAGVFFGPWIGGLCGAVGDILNVILVPSGAPIPALTLLEFLVGFVCGTLFYNQQVKNKTYIVKCFICAIIMFLIDMLLTTLVLLSVGYFPNFAVAFSLRLPAGIIKAVIQLVFFLFGYQYIEILRKALKMPKRG